MIGIKLLKENRMTQTSLACDEKSAVVLLVAGRDAHLHTSWPELVIEFRALLFQILEVALVHEIARIPRPTTVLVPFYLGQSLLAIVATHVKPEAVCWTKPEQTMRRFVLRTV